MNIQDMLIDILREIRMMKQLQMSQRDELRQIKRELRKMFTYLLFVYVLCKISPSNCNVSGGSNASNASNVSNASNGDLLEDLIKLN